MNNFVKASNWSQTIWGDSDPEFLEEYTIDSEDVKDKDEIENQIHHLIWV